MNLRRVSDADADALVSFDLGAVRNPWLAEVAEIVRGLVAWECDPDQFALDRQVFVLADSRLI